MDALEWTMQGTSIKHVGWREDVEIPTRPGGSPPQQACNRTPDKQIRKTSLSTTNLPHLTARPVRAPARTIPVWVWPARSQFSVCDSRPAIFHQILPFPIRFGHFPSDFAVSHQIWPFPIRFLSDLAISHQILPCPIRFAVSHQIWPFPIRFCR